MITAIMMTKTMMMTMMIIMMIMNDDDDYDDADADPACYSNIVLCVICCHFFSTEASLALEPAEAHLDVTLSTGLLHCTSTTQ